MAAIPKKVPVILSVIQVSVIQRCPLIKLLPGDDGIQDCWQSGCSGETPERPLLLPENEKKINFDNLLYICFNDL